MRTLTLLLSILFPVFALLLFGFLLVIGGNIIPPPADIEWASGEVLAKMSYRLFRQNWWIWLIMGVAHAANLWLESEEGAGARRAWGRRLYYGVELSGALIVILAAGHLTLAGSVKINPEMWFAATPALLPGTLLTSFVAGLPAWLSLTIHLLLLRRM